ncbi:MAG: citramalate synthase [Candidatus Omnitrophica bacterium CG08_land_8_20_14_0_20_41_16]|uniref:Citramalate synthase n=1 Tax=Candidatus Sherwoodlollariibacterium unditelluris TaxID=1974757 RepID=A0A2G9YKK4_9BACT|nr:MAG: citramalate synthase [Candidatus Omnitrophica bacterium CG23_combo_of_CG06-09_8_20_14_all_41_10]PIS34180.1 MAG: citramalate synthase [Candidatus Omnitrophica bacterium CG08_land_8_20_14_0_20_41_16]
MAKKNNKSYRGVSLWGASPRQIKIYDTTLRDGAQGEGISYSVMDKIRIASELDMLGIHYIEGGWPGANPKDREFFLKMAKIRLKNSQLAAFSMTRRPKIEAANDSNIKSLIKSGAKIITIVGKTWNLHVTDVLRVSLDENINMIKDTISFITSCGLTVFYDAEHFFDAYKSNSEYAVNSLIAAQDSGAKAICLCDTNGGTLTSEISKIVFEVKDKIKVSLGIHCHNDAGMAIANSLAAVEAGVDIVQGTINGIGERCGNADLIPIIANLKLKMGFDCITDENLKKITHLSHYVSEISNMKQRSDQPYVGASSFAHKGGMHINAIMKNCKTYEHIEPALVGNNRRILVSELGGKTSVLIRAKDLALGLDKDDPKTKKIMQLVQKLEHQGYHFEAAEASFEILMKRALKKYKKFFELEGFRVIIEKGVSNKITSEAIIKLRVKGQKEHTVAMGDGPINALDNALRKALKEFYPTLSKMHLSDFKVRVLDEKAGTAARVRVLIQSQDEKDSWNTIGVSENIIEASWQALADSVEYKLLKDKVTEASTNDR